MFLNFKNESQTSFENRKWNYPHRKWNYLTQKFFRLNFFWPNILFGSKISDPNLFGPKIFDPKFCSDKKNWSKKIWLKKILTKNFVGSKIFGPKTFGLKNFLTRNFFPTKIWPNIFVGVFVQEKIWVKLLWTIGPHDPLWEYRNLGIKSTMLHQSQYVAYSGKNLSLHSLPNLAPLTTSKLLSQNLSKVLTGSFQSTGLFLFICNPLRPPQAPSAPLRPPQ